jgi:hypothetical protein
VCLSTAWNIANGTSTGVTRRTALGAIMDRMGELYPQAGIPLTVAIGSFCSYCESYSTGGLHVEHVVPKSPFVALEIDWDNFLLACPPCNSIKSNRPTYAAVKAIPPALTNPTSIAACRTTVRSMYEFPDDNATAFQDYPQVLCYLNAVTGAWTPLTLAQSVDLANQLVSKDLVTRQVTARIPTVSANAVQVSVLVQPPGAPAADLTNNLCQLNRTPPALDPLRTADQRLFNRTVAWFDALSALAVLTAAPPSTFYSFWALFVLGVQNAGFWSVWITILSKFTDPVSGANLATRFLADPTIAAAYPGTNTTNIVYPTRP